MTPRPQETGPRRSRYVRDFGWRRRAPDRRTSTSSFMVAAAAAAAALFFVLWWMLQGEENPWVPAGLAASVVMLVAASAREFAVRRTLRRHIQEQGNREPGVEISSETSRPLRSRSSLTFYGQALRSLQKQAAEADQNDALPAAHLEVFRLCGEYLSSTKEALRSQALPSEGRLALRTGQERVRALQRQHMLAWAKGEARSLTHEAQERVRLHEKVEIGNRALNCIDSALKLYPDAEELNQSATAVREFITSSRVAHWVELAERAAFKGYYRRAIDCYCDALFFLTRDKMDADREAAAEQITRQIDLLRARLDTEDPEHPALDITELERKKRKRRSDSAAE